MSNKVSFRYFKTKAAFDNELTNNKSLCDNSICFIQDAKEIYTHEQFYNCSEYNDAEIRELITNLESTLNSKVDLSAFELLENEVEDNEEVTAAALTKLNEDKANKSDIPDVSDFVTTDELNALSSEVENKADSSALDNYYTKTESDDKYALKASLGSYASVEYVDNQIEGVSDEIDEVSTEVTNLKISHNTLSETVSTINNNYLSKTDAEQYIDQDELGSAIDELNDVIDTKQPLLDADDFKTINGTSVWGSGSITTPDTKVTSAANHYTPTTATTKTGIVGELKYDSKGHITEVTTRSLTETDIPGLSASKITSGTLSIDRLPAGALERLFIVESETAAMNTTVQEGDVVKVTANNKMYFCVDDEATTFANKFIEFTAGTATSVPWSGITDKPDGIDGWGDRISVIEGDYFKSSSFTQANIKSTLGISDWALASVKPTYTASEVGALGVNDTATNASKLDGVEISNMFKYYGHNADLNSFVGGNKQSTTHYINTTDTTITNAPSYYGTAVNFGAYVGNFQLFANNINKLYFRQRWTSNWGDWKTLAFTSDIPTKLSDLTDDVVAGKYLSTQGGTINGSLTAPTFIGNLTGNADSASKLYNTTVTFTPAETALTPAEVRKLVDGTTMKRGSWGYASNGYIASDTTGFGAIDLAGTSVIQILGTSGNWTQLYLTASTATTSGAKTNEIFMYCYNGDTYSPSWTRVLTNRNYNSYALPLSGGTLTGDLSGTNAIMSGLIHASSYLRMPAKSINTDVADSFRTSLFSTTSEGYARFKIFRTDASNLDVLPGNYAASIGWSCADTHAYLSVPYIRNASFEATIGAGNHDTIQWSAKLLHSLNYSSYCLPKDGTASSATKLATARTIWGQSFDGTANISGHFQAGDVDGWCFMRGTQNIFRIADAGLVISPYDKTSGFIALRTGSDTDSSGNTEIRLLSSGYVGIGTANPTTKLEVSGAIKSDGLSTSSGITLTGTDSATKSTIAFSRTTYNYITSPSGSNIGIHPGGLAIAVNTGYKFSSASFSPGATNTYNLGTSTSLWKTAYIDSVLATRVDTSEFRSNGVSLYSFNMGKTDNGGRATFRLISDVTDIYNGTSIATAGLLGTFFVKRINSGVPIADFANVSCIIGYNKNQVILKTTSKYLMPHLIKYNDKYYLAIEIKGSGRIDTYYGYKYSTLDTFENLLVPSGATVPEGVEIVVNGKYTNHVSSVDSTSKLYLIGAIAQGYAQDTYSNSGVYATNGIIYATDFSTTSDSRLKDFVSDIQVDFDLLKSIPKKYYYWNDKSMGEDLQIGTSAQELMKVYPECVSYDKDQDRYSVNYQKLSIVALAAIDKLHDRISELEKKIND